MLFRDISPLRVDVLKSYLRILYLLLSNEETSAEDLRMKSDGSEMATADEDKQRESSLFGSFYQKAKEKTLSTLALVRQDLTEFGEAVRDEGSSLMTMTTNAIRDQASSFEAASNMMKSFVDTVSYVLFEDTTKGEELFEEPIVADSPEGLFDFESLDLEPAGNPETFALWQSTFNLREREAECERLLQSQPELLEVYQNLVPREIDRLTFWQRFFYRMYQIDNAKEESRGSLPFEGDDKSPCNNASVSSQTVQSSSTALSPNAVEEKCFGGSSNDSTLEVSDDDDEGAVIVSHRAVNDQFEPQ